MTTRIPRRTLIGAGPLALAACKTADAGYFGRVEPPKSRRLIYLIGAEPATLDPAKSVDRSNARSAIVTISREWE